MKFSRQKTILVNEPSLSDLEMVCDRLNFAKDAALRSELRRLVECWRKSGPNLQNMVYEDQDLWKDMQSAWQTLWIPSRNRGARFGLVPGDQFDDSSSVKKRARLLFCDLTLNPEWRRLGGPCPRCERYFVKKTLKQTIYCSRPCAWQTTAVKSTRRAREEDHNEKISRASALAQEWERFKTADDWKTWVSVAAPEITPKFLTRAVNNGELIPPVKMEKTPKTGVAFHPK